MGDYYIILCQLSKLFFEILINLLKAVESYCLFSIYFIDIRI